MSARVFVPQNANRLDLSAAEQWGELVYCVRGQIYADNVPERVSKSLEILYSKMYDFNPEEDYILLTGDPVCLVIVGFLIGAMFADVDGTNLRGSTSIGIKCLKWDRESRAYFVVRI